jgi:hypothetical protein
MTVRQLYSIGWYPFLAAATRQDPCPSAGSSGTLPGTLASALPGNLYALRAADPGRVAGY